jgi:hypothetical protein
MYFGGKMTACLPANVSRALFTNDNGYNFNHWKDTAFLCKLPSISAAAFEAVRRLSAMDCHSEDMVAPTSSDEVMGDLVTVVGYVATATLAVFEIATRISFVMVNFIAQVGLMLASAFDIQLPESLQYLRMDQIYAPTIGAARDSAIAFVSSLQGIYSTATDEKFEPKIPFENL